MLETHLQRPYIDYVRRNICQWLGKPAAPGTFCSEFVVDVLRAWGMWGEGRPSRLYVPRDFAEPCLRDACTPGFSRVLTLKEGSGPWFKDEMREIVYACWQSTVEVVIHGPGESAIQRKPV
ncbi:MAG: hypothetical protein HKM02_07880 [Pseudomonadales bacterium]|nr:hypothetical protein [Pseudomonadales bacterium]